MAQLTIDNVELSFRGVRALRGVSLSAAQGDLVAVIGPNGAGKTSLFNCISGVYTPDSGSVVFDDHELHMMRPHTIAGLGVARMFQNIALFEHMTVLENIMLGRHHLYKHGWFKDMFWPPSVRAEEVRHRARVEEIIDFLHLQRYRQFPAGLLPYGVLKRVELGRALAMEPQLLLLDEPAAGLNQEETEDMARFILDIKEEFGITQLLIEHELHLVLDLADRIAVLDFGCKIADGTPAEIRADERVIDAYVGVGAGEEE